MYLYYNVFTVFSLTLTIISVSPSEVAAVGTFSYCFYKKTHLQLFCLSQISHLGHQEKCSTWEKNLTQLWNLNLHCENLSSEPYLCFLHVFFCCCSVLLGFCFCHDRERAQIQIWDIQKLYILCSILPIYILYINILYLVEKLKIISSFHPSYTFLHLHLKTDFFRCVKKLFAIICRDIRLLP